MELGKAHMDLTRNPGFTFCVFSFLEFQVTLLWDRDVRGDGGTDFGHFASRVGC
jgi:hypothetical protein